MAEKIEFFNRGSGQREVEKVYGDGAVKFLYESSVGRILTPILVTKTISQIYGSSQNTRSSGAKVPEFVKKFDIDLHQYQPGSLSSEKQENSYKSFNEFFIRSFREGQRTFCENSKLAAFSEARYFGFERIDENICYPVKGKFLSPTEMIANKKYDKVFKKGPLLIARLCPVDYHRYHYPDSGRTIDSYSIRGQFHSVNPLALKKKGNILISNERRVAILESEHFGKLAYIEVGAICVGKIVQSFDETQDFKRGDEKGYFLFGGSTVIVIGEEGRWRPSEDILHHSKEGRETYIQLGDDVGQ